jgi:hypothetical protein
MISFKQFVLESKIAININDSVHDFTGQILRGEKTIETRDAFIKNPEKASLHPYIGREVGIIRTGKGKAFLVGKCVIGNPVVYHNSKEFDKDYSKHLVSPDSKYYIKPVRNKIGYPLLDVTPLKPTEVTTRGNVSRRVEY